MDEKKKLKRKKAIIILMSLFLLTPKAVNCHYYSPQIELVQDDEAFAAYRNGNVYIGDARFLRSIKDQVTENDILVLDERDSDDPNMMIYNSYKIQSRDERNDILEILQLYERMYPSEWQRSIESMRREWAVHNLFYGMNFRLKNTSHVDLNNADEEVYNQELVKYFFN